MPFDPRLIPPDQAPPSPLLDQEAETPMVPQWELDWDRYWEEFSRAHGGRPVQLDDWIVFEDGWSHDAYIAGGTERPPDGGVEYDYSTGAIPENADLRELMAAYYRERCNLVSLTRRKLFSIIDGIKSLRGKKHLPLCIRSVLWNAQRGEDGFTVWSPTLHEGELQDQQMRKLENDFAWLDSDMRYCEERIAKLREGVKHGQT